MQREVKQCIVDGDLTYLSGSLAVAQEVMRRTALLMPARLDSPSVAAIGVAVSGPECSQHAAAAAR